jgi:hypothetical protein
MRRPGIMIPFPVSEQAAIGLMQAQYAADKSAFGAREIDLMEWAERTEARMKRASTLFCSLLEGKLFSIDCTEIAAHKPDPRDCTVILGEHNVRGTLVSFAAWHEEIEDEYVPVPQMLLCDREFGEFTGMDLNDQLVYVAIPGIESITVSTDLPPTILSA